MRVDHVALINQAVQEEVMPIPPLSEAIILGSHITVARAGLIDHCALGMAANAIGLPKHDLSSRYKSIPEAWPWVGGLGSAGWAFVAITYNNHVAPGSAQDMTLEQLADKVREMEPKCSCHRFNCDCSAKMVLSDPKEELKEELKEDLKEELKEEPTYAPS